MDIGITLPLPGARLHAHAKGHWRAKASATSAARSLALSVARVKSLSPSCRRPGGRKQIDYLFFVPDRRRRDEANLVQSCKPYIDGLVDAGVLERDDWEYLHTRSIVVEVDRVDPRVELIISDWEF